MEDFETFIAFVAVIFGILQIILFFKIWGMTNDVREIKEHFCNGSTNNSQAASASVTNRTSSTVSTNAGKLYSVSIQGDYMKFSNVRPFVESVRKFYIKCLQSHCKYEEILKGILQIIEIEGKEVSKAGFDPKKVAVDVVNQLEKVAGK